MLILKPTDSFWENVEATGCCWYWTGPEKNGYGSVARRWEGTAIQGAHRVAYSALVGLVPKGKHLDHICKIKLCVNPDHLEPVTPKVNAERRSSVITHCPQGHPYDAENTYTSPSNRRHCRKCGMTRMRIRRATKP